MSDTIRGTAIGDVIDALIATADTATKIADNITDGLPEKFNSGTYLCVGVDDWTPGNTADSASSTIDWAHSDNFQSEEVGTITCVAVCQKGGSGQAKVARDEALAIVSALKARLITALGGTTSDVLDVPGLWDVKVGGVDSLTQSSDANGATAIARFSIPYRARI